MTTPSTLVHLRLDEPKDAVRPSDLVGSLQDLAPAVGGALAPVVDAFTGRGRSFALGRAFYASDVTPGASLATRDTTVRAILSWDIVGQTTWTLTNITGDWNVPGSVGVSSANTIAGDGFVEFAAASDSQWYLIGLSQNDTTTVYGGVLFGWMLRQDTGHAVVYESGGQVFDGGVYAPGDVFRVERVGTAIMYRKNGVVVYTSALTSSVQLRIDTAFLATSGTIGGIRLVDAGSAVPLTWQNVVNLTPRADVLGTIVARGKGTSAAEYLAYGLELRVVNALTRVGELRFVWQDTAGNLKTQLGGQFVAPSSGFFMLTAVRRWVSATQVELRYYAGGQLIGEFLSSDGSIGGGTTGTFTLGARCDTSGLSRYLCGVVDELQVFNYEISAEETAATWDRLSRLQPRGYRAIRDLMQPGAPISNEPTSRIQKLLRIVGHGIGYAAAQVENFRQNLLPDRAYGPALERWENTTSESPKPTDSIAVRRKRVVAHFRQRSGATVNGQAASGVSVPGVESALADLLAVAPSQLQVLALDQTIRDDFSAGLKTTRWMVNPSAQWTIASNALRVQAAGSAFLQFDGTNRTWYTCLANVGGSRANPNLAISTARFDGLGAHFLAKVAPTAIPTSGEVGVAFYDLALGNALLFGIRNNGGTYQLITEAFRKWVSQGVTVQATTSLITHWLHLYQNVNGTALLPPGIRIFDAAWSTTGQLTGYTTAPDIQHPQEFHWMGMYSRSVGGVALGGALDVSFDDVIMRSPGSTRSLRFYVYRDPTLPGAPDLAAAELALQRIRQAHTDAHVTQSLAFKATDPYSQAGRTPTTY